MRKIYLLLLGVAMGFGVHAQSISPDVIANAGDEQTVGSTTVSWTIGEVMIETNTGTSAAITQGFHQPMYGIVAVDESGPAAYDIHVYPSPATDVIWIKIERDENIPLNVELIDISGKILASRSTTVQNGRIGLDLTEVALGNYMLRITNEGLTYRKTFKIQKIY